MMHLAGANPVDWLRKAATQKDGLDDQLEQGAGLASFSNLLKWAKGES